LPPDSHLSSAVTPVTWGSAVMSAGSKASRISGVPEVDLEAAD